MIMIIIALLLIIIGAVIVGLGLLPHDSCTISVIGIIFIVIGIATLIATPRKRCNLQVTTVKGTEIYRNCTYTIGRENVLIETFDDKKVIYYNPIEIKELK